MNKNTLCLWGLSWQITPRVLTEAMAQGGEVARRAFEAAVRDARLQGR